MKMLKMLTLTETQLLLREPLAFFWGVAFPMVLLTVMGLSASKIDGVSLVADTADRDRVHQRCVRRPGDPGTDRGLRQGRILRRLATTRPARCG